MNYFSYIIFLLSLSGLSLVMLALLHLLDRVGAASRQKMILHKIGLAMLGCAPFIFILLRMQSWHTLAIILPHQMSQLTSAHTQSITFFELQSHGLFYVITLYGIGLFVMLCRIFLSYLSAIKQLLASLPVVIQGQSVFLNPYIQCPLNFGFIRGKIYFPMDAEMRWSPRAIQMSLAHEKIHLEQNDALWKLLSLVVQALLFFAPWSYSLHRKLELEIEILCDEKARLETGADSQEYGNLLLAMTCGQSNNLIYTNMADSNLKRRLLAMKSNTHIGRPFLTSILSAALLLAGSTAIAMTSGMTEKKSSFKITSKIFIDGKLLSSPLIVVYAQQPASITLSNDDATQSLRVGLVVKDVEMTGIKDAIGISYDIQYKNGKESMHTQPQIVVAPHKEGVVTISSGAGHAYEMHVLAERE